MRKRAEKILTDIAAAHNAKLSETGNFPMGVTVEAVDILEVELTAAVKEEREERAKLEIAVREVVEDWAYTKTSKRKTGHLDALTALLNYGPKAPEVPE